ncbi:MAG: glycosyltransferase family 2 protein [Patescibacteria group bacterium]|jgi:(heptosyl)LPS beta-1,4-glucosyltransferase
MAIKPQLSIIILAGNEESMIEDCLKSCLFADEIILVAANSTDNTVNIAKKTASKLKVFKTFDEYNKNFSKWRNIGYKHSQGNWLLYVDSDERITPELKSEILDTINNPTPHSYFVIPRANHYLGKRVKYGGSYPDYVKRLYQKAHFKGYKGALHEEPIVKGSFGYLKSDLLHFTHRDLTSMLNKTIVWTDMEAQALYASNHPPVVWWRFLRMMLTKFYERLIREQMYKDGTIGWISVIFETFNTFIIYARLWEMQQSHNKKAYYN